MSIYLDYNASAPIDPRVLETMIEVYTNNIGNADSRTHDFGNAARVVVEKARSQVASLIGVTPSEVFFTSGATEGNNIAIQGLADYAEKTGKKHILTTSIEHKAIIETVKSMEHRGYKATFVDPQNDGIVAAPEMISHIQDDTLLVSMMHVNNETGMIQPVFEVAEYLANKDILFHVDATQSCGKLIPEIRNLKYNMLTFSAHKLRGPQGIGVLVLRKNRYKLPPVKPIMYGGQQEHGIRPGTIPVALVAGCGRACELAAIEHEENAGALKNRKRLILRLLAESGIEYRINGDQDFCLDNTLNVSFNNVSSEALMITTKQYCAISNGSACTSKNYSPSYVLSAMGLPMQIIESSVRLSWGAEVDLRILEEEFKSLMRKVKELQL